MAFNNLQGFQPNKCPLSQLLDKNKELNDSLAMQMSLEEELVAANEDLKISNEMLHE